MMESPVRLEGREAEEPGPAELPEGIALSGFNRGRQSHISCYEHLNDRGWLFLSAAITIFGIMPIDILIDRQHELVLLGIFGELEFSDLLGCEYQVVSISNGNRFSVIVDLRRVDRVPPLSAHQIGQLATLFLRTNPLNDAPPRVAIAAGDDFYGIARAFEARCNEDGNPKRVAVFHTLQAAATFLDVPFDALPKNWHLPAD